MDESQFAERMTAIRTRFASKLTIKFQETEAALPHLAGAACTAVDAVAAAYRRFHDVCGVGPTIGFDQTGRAARILDYILVGPFREQRGLSDAELAQFTEGLASLRAAAHSDMQSTNSDRELVS